MPLICKKRKIINDGHSPSPYGRYKGGDITSSIISKIPYELHLRDTSFKNIAIVDQTLN